MTQGSQRGDDSRHNLPKERKRKLSRSELRMHVEETRADIERQLQVRKAQLDATNERIKARTGRNLVFAVVIGLVVGAIFLLSLIFVKEVFVFFAAALVGFAAFELAQAFRGSGRNIPRVPTIIAAVAVVPASFFYQSVGQLVALTLGIVLVIVWSLIASKRGTDETVSHRELIRDLTWSIFVQMYVTLLGSFAVLLVAADGGEWWVLGFVVVAVSVDTGAYVSGLLWGKHPMAPSISPKKTWEGFAGAVVAAIISGILIALFALHLPALVGVIFGVVILLTATAGDLAESLIKRDLGIKDMSSWFPGHGGFLDRLDSILPSAAATYVLFLIFS